MTLMVLLSALICDRLFGEPQPHPLVLFGRCARRVEEACRRLPLTPLIAGGLAWFVLVVPISVLVFFLVAAVAAPLAFVLEVGVVYLCVAHRSLAEHARAVRDALDAGNLVKAREQLALFVSRDTGELNHEGVAAGATESVLENGSDAVVATLFWAVILGPAGALAHRLANTLDAMWGYRSERYALFGRVAARADDLLNWVPARLCALAYCAAGQTSRAWRCWRVQAAQWDSPNAGPVMAAGAGALGVQLGGPASYGGEQHARPALGEGLPATASSIDEALGLLANAVLLLLCVFAVGYLLWR